MGFAAVSIEALLALMLSELYVESLCDVRCVRHQFHDGTHRFFIFFLFNVDCLTASTKADIMQSVRKLPICEPQVIYSIQHIHMTFINDMEMFYCGFSIAQEQMTIKHAQQSAHLGKCLLSVSAAIRFFQSTNDICTCDLIFADFFIVVSSQCQKDWHTLYVPKGFVYLFVPHFRVFVSLRIFDTLQFFKILSTFRFLSIHCLFSYLRGPNVCSLFSFNLCMS